MRTVKQRIIREAISWSIILGAVILTFGVPAWYLNQHPELLLTFTPTATGMSFSTLPATTTKEPEKLLIATQGLPVATGTVGLVIAAQAVEVRATQGLPVATGTVGLVIAAQAVEVRDLPEGFGDESHNVGYLLPGDTVQEIKCQQLGADVWVFHSRGWSIVRSASNEYITKVCEE